MWLRYLPDDLVYMGKWLLIYMVTRRLTVVSNFGGRLSSDADTSTADLYAAEPSSDSLMGNLDRKPVMFTPLRFILGQRYAGGCMLMSAIAAHTCSISPWHLHVHTR